MGTPYSQGLSASGGTGSYTWSISSGSLPAGLSLAGGTIGGTPTAPGTASFTVQVTDSANTTATQPLSIAVAPATLSVSTTSLAGGTVGTPYSQGLSASGGTGSYTWSVSSGSLPAGLSLAGGTIGGTPTAPGTASFTVQVTDSANTTATQPLSIAVAPATLSVSTTSLPGGTVGTPYSQGLSASGGTGSYTWSVSSGSLPAGLSLAGGTIGGTPTAPGTASFTVQVTDSANTTATQPLSIAVAPAPLSVSTTSLAGGTVGTPYSQGLSASGGTGSYTWSVSSGSLPAGLSLAGGTIGGTPTAPGTASFTVQVTDSANTTATQPLSIAVAPAPLNVSTTSLPGGTVGTPYSQGLSASGGTGSYTWSDLVGVIARRIVASGWDHWRHPDRPRHRQLHRPGHRQRQHHRHAAIEHCGRAGGPERLHDIPARRHCGHALLAGLVREWWHRQPAPTPLATQPLSIAVAPATLERLHDIPARRHCGHCLLAGLCPRVGGTGTTPGRSRRVHCPPDCR